MYNNIVWVKCDVLFAFCCCLAMLLRYEHILVQMLCIAHVQVTNMNQKKMLYTGIIHFTPSYIFIDTIYYNAKFSVLYYRNNQSHRVRQAMYHTLKQKNAVHKSNWKLEHVD